jgi:hypothetical protein
LRGLRRSLPPTNPYQEHKNMRPVRDISLTDRSTMEETTFERERGELTKERRTKSPLEIKLSMEESSNRHREDLGAETRAWEREIRREN